MEKQPPIRLDQTLMARARRRASLEHRSIPGQIGYWASIGERISELLTADQVAALMENKARIEVEPALDMDSILSDVEASRDDSEVADSICAESGDVRYGADPGDKQRLVSSRGRSRTAS